jgi:hypothetical protein
MNLNKKILANHEFSKHVSPITTKINLLREESLFFQETIAATNKMVYILLEKIILNRIVFREIMQSIKNNPLYKNKETLIFINNHEDCLLGMETLYLSYLTNKGSIPKKSDPIEIVFAEIKRIMLNEKEDLSIYFNKNQKYLISWNNTMHMLNEPLLRFINRQKKSKGSSLKRFVLKTKH